MPITINTKDKRIAKLYAKGLRLDQIARKIGMPGNIDRVMQGLIRERLLPLDVEVNYMREVAKL